MCCCNPPSSPYHLYIYTSYNMYFQIYPLMHIFVHCQRFFWPDKNSTFRDMKRTWVQSRVCLSIAAPVSLLHDWIRALSEPHPIVEKIVLFEVSSAPKVTKIDGSLPKRLSGRSSRWTWRRNKNSPAWRVHNKDLRMVSTRGLEIVNIEHPPHYLQASGWDHQHWSLGETERFASTRSCPLAYCLRRSSAGTRSFESSSGGVTRANCNPTFWTTSHRTTTSAGSSEKRAGSGTAPNAVDFAPDTLDPTRFWVNPLHTSSE